MLHNCKKIVVFDVDGTLFDTKQGILDALEDVCNHFGLDNFNREDGDKYIGPSIKASMMKYYGLDEERAEEATLYYRQVYVGLYIQNSKPYDGVLDVISKLKSVGYCLALATNKTICQVEKLFSVTGMDLTQFTYVKTALEEGGLTKTEMLKQIVDESGSIASVVMVGDTDGDRKAAEEAGADFIGVSYGYGFNSQESYGFVMVDSPDGIYRGVI